MTEQPATIASLIDALNRAWDAYQDAPSQKARKARNTRVINCGVALRQRLAELAEWLHAHDTEQDEDRYLDNLHKYEDGWRALDRVAVAIDEWKRNHYIELTEEEFARRGIRRRTNDGASRAGEAKSPAAGQTQSDDKALAQRILRDHRNAIAGEPGTRVPEFVQSELV